MSAAADAVSADRLGEQRAISEFGVVLKSMTRLQPFLDKLRDDADVIAGQKRLCRAAMLHRVLLERFPRTKVEDVRTMSVEYLHGMLEATWPLETRLSDAGFVDEAAVNPLIAALDTAGRWAHTLTVLMQEAGECAAEEVESSSNDTPLTHAQAADFIRSATAAGDAKMGEVISRGASPQVHVLGADLYESLCWRRGALRYYVAKSLVTRASGGQRTDLDAAGSALAAHGELLADALAALRLLLGARGSEGGGGESGGRMRQLLSWGIYSTTHLLALAYSGELSAYHWALLVKGGGGGRGGGRGGGWEWGRGGGSGRERWRFRRQVDACPSAPPRPSLPVCGGGPHGRVRVGHKDTLLRAPAARWR